MSCKLYTRAIIVQLLSPWSKSGIVMLYKGVAVYANLVRTHGVVHEAVKSRAAKIVLDTEHVQARASKFFQPNRALPCVLDGCGQDFQAYASDAATV